MFARWLQRQWFEQRRLSPALWLLLPLSWLFAGLAALNRRHAKPVRLPVPVIVVGNITVGGAGKTPLTIWLARQLKEQGWRPGIVSRGYGGENAAPRAVSPFAVPAEVGDEPILLARRSGVPVWVGRDRAAAAQALLAAQPEVNIILCDDGLQHYRLGRDVELAVFDGRGAGNGWRLPVGPLREPLSRIAAVDAVICNGLPDARLPAAVPSFAMRLLPGNFYRLDEPQHWCEAAALAGKKLYAMAGIGDPGRFFRMLEGLGLACETHPFPDHHAYTAGDLAFAKDGILLMTEKDAVKCAGLTAGETWVLPVEAELSPALIEHIQEKLRGRQAA
ncbi:tetraacyldisaccharide 4'-kinase [Dechloromonas denitrificans]|uniref:Tetraacyldisaccharide 4'-kinase n=1 Tax=Dechloromonas denitrificans TaxID=281362 RepID=A0A133XHK6_9RHOO|nr:tetraacyldisaccharide 4'-kinase [Dechloromonas denitrificans]KXB30434.1 tetraacyldisaccharide 4'-kinase [Dechloromonas denitrificans]